MFEGGKKINIQNSKQFFFNSFIYVVIKNIKKNALPVSPVVHVAGADGGPLPMLLTAIT